MVLITPRLKLREVLSSDLENIYALHSLPETDQFNTSGIPSSIDVTKQLLADWLAMQHEEPRKKYVFCIENGNAFVGLIGVNMGKPAYRNAEIWYKLHPQYWNKGYATEAVMRILQFGFYELNLHRIGAGCAVGNTASIRVLEKVGMTREGHCRKLLPIRGEWVDNYEYAILETDIQQNVS